MENLDVTVFFFHGLQTSKVAYVLCLLSKVRQISRNLVMTNEDTGYVDSVFGLLNLKLAQAL